MSRWETRYHKTKIHRINEHVANALAPNLEEEISKSQLIALWIGASQDCEYLLKLFEVKE